MWEFSRNPRGRGGNSVNRGFSARGRGRGPGGGPPVYQASGSHRGRGSHRGLRTNFELEVPQVMPCTTLTLSFEDFEALRSLVEAATTQLIPMLSEQVALRNSFILALSLPFSQTTGALLGIVTALLDDSNHPQWTSNALMNRQIFSWLCRTGCPLDPPTRARGLTVMLRAAPEIDYCEAASEHLKLHESSVDTEWFSALKVTLDEALASARAQQQLEENAATTRRYFICEYTDVPPALASASVFPTLEELQDERPNRVIHRSLRGVCVHQRLTWEQCDAHIRTQFRLVKEDLLASLRESFWFLSQHPIRWNLHAGQVASDIRKALNEQRAAGRRIRVYFYVGMKLRGYEVHSRLGFVASFYLNPHVNRAVSAKRLMKGNLLVMVPQNDGFGNASAKNVVMGTICGSSTNLNKFLLHINNMETLIDLSTRGMVDYVAIESTVFFTPCERVLTSLRNLDAKKARRTAPPILATVVTGVPAEPHYLRNMRFNLSKAIALINSKDSMWDPLNGTVDNFLPWSLESERRLRDGLIAVLDTTQRDALPYALRHSVAVIQGTPGTGKTFIGVKLLQILYENLSHTGPIVVMCQTNHAIDSFLLDVLKFVDPEHVARIGTSKNPQLSELQAQPHGGFAFDKETRSQAEELIRMQKFVWNATGSSQKMEDLITSHLRAEYCDDPDVQKLLSWIQEMSTTAKQLRTTPARLSRATYELSMMGSIEQLEEREMSAHDARQKCNLLLKTLCTEANLTFDEAEVNSSIAESSHVELHLQDYLDMCSNVDEANEFLQYHRKHRHTLQKIIHEIESRKKLDSEISRCRSAIETHQRLTHLVNVLTLELKELEGKGPTLKDSDGILEWWRQQPSATTLQLFRGDASKFVHGFFTPSPNTHDAKFDEELRAQEVARRDEEELEDNVDHAEATVIPFTPSKEERLRRVRHASSVCVTQDAHKPHRDDAVTMLIEELYYGLNDEMRILLRQSSDGNFLLHRGAEAFVNKHVIGGTTVGIMKILPILETLQVKVLFVEEAAEVLESHVLACLTGSLTHLFLIGDHKQLKPQVEEYSLETRLNLGVSLMERLAIIGYPLVTLTTQRRMHPDISQLTKNYYQIDGVEICDHPCTERPIIPVLGPIDDPRRLVYLTYTPTEQCCEEQDKNLDSPFNAHEIGIAAAVFHYLHVINGISATVLVPYTAQKLHTLNFFEQMHLPLRISTVDEFQGDEDTAIILSLTRTERPGFLNAENRSCVALSRARDLFVVIGARCMIESPKCTNQMLRDFIDHCDRTGATTTTIQCHCEQHRTSFHFASWDEYVLLGRGKCSLPCGVVRKCGHVCRYQCHGRQLHPPCPEPCARVGVECDGRRTCDHPCAKECSYPCDLCRVEVAVQCKACGEPQTVQCHVGIPQQCNKVRIAEASCGHEVEASCSEHVSGGAYLKCTSMCNNSMNCGHVCDLPCHHGRDDNHVEAMKKCTKLRSGIAICGHPKELTCNIFSTGRCKEKCSRMPPCGIEGHFCKDLCGHTPQCCCSSTVIVKFDCGHATTVPCGVQPDMCVEICKKLLPCGHTCTEICEQCSRRSFHRCNQRCAKLLLCGHICHKSCGEPCENLCIQPCSPSSCKHNRGCTGEHSCGECAFQCKEPCLWNCPHHKCEKRCFEECHRPVCHFRCEKSLPCGHRCAGLCGEECLDYCPQCFATSPDIFQKPDLLTDLDKIDAERLLRGQYTNEGEEGALLHRMPCGKLIRVLELERSLMSNTGLAIPVCPSCNVPLFADDFRRCGPLIRRSRQHIFDIHQRVRTDRATLLVDSNELVRQTVDEILGKALKLSPDAKIAVSNVIPMRLVEVPVVTHIRRAKNGNLRDRLTKQEQGYKQQLEQRARSLEAMRSALVKLPHVAKVLEFLFNIRDGPRKHIDGLGNVCRLAAERIMCEVYSRRYKLDATVTQPIMNVVRGFDGLWDKRDLRGVNLHLPEVEWSRRLLQAHIIANAELVHRVEKIRAAVIRESTISIPWTTVIDIEKELIPAMKRRVLLAKITRALGATATRWVLCPNGHLYDVIEGLESLCAGCPSCPDFKVDVSFSPPREL